MSRFCVITQQQSFTLITNKMGGQKSEDCNSLAEEIWEWCMERNLGISSAHIPSWYKVEADLYSRELEDATKWQLNPTVFKNIIKTFGTPDLDLLVSRINKQLAKCVSWHPDPEAWATDVCSLVWKQIYFYKFPPFSLVGKVLSKAFKEKTRATIIIANWPSQHWYPRILSLATAILDIKPRGSNLRLTHKPSTMHPLSKQIELLTIKVIMKLLSKYWMYHYVKVLELSIAYILDSGNCLWVQLGT